MNALKSISYTHRYCHGVVRAADAFSSSLSSSVFSNIGAVRYMSKFLSRAATKRLPLTTKRAGKGYYKGKGGTKEGRLTSKAKFIVDHSKRLQLVVPDLEGFKVRFFRNNFNFVTGIYHVTPNMICFSPTKPNPFFNVVAQAICGSQYREDCSRIKRLMI